MSGYVSNGPKGYRNKGVEPVDIGAQRWAEYPDLPPKAEDKPNAVGCTFTKPCKLPDGVINYASSAIPTDAIKEFGEFALLGGRETDASGNITLGKISGNIPASLGTLALGGRALASAGASCGGLCTAGTAATAGAVTGGGTGAGVGAGVGVSTGTAATGAGTTGITAGVVAGALVGVVALLWPSSLGDSSLYTPEQLKALKEGRTRVRLHIEEQADGTLKGYGYNTEKRADWEMIPVVQFELQDSQQVADFGDGVTLTWTPAVDPSSTSGIPPLEAAPQAPQIWIYPPTEQADNIIVNPLYPPEYKDFILVFPIGSGVQPLYIVMNVRKKPGTATGRGQDVTGIWLAGAGTGLGVPIPSQIADQLRGQEFTDFDSFREALWELVAKDPELSQQFNERNLKGMLNGLAPVTPRNGHAGKRISFELHHIELIKDGGAVYDTDNINVVTPRRHIDIHRGVE
ncbi:S-type pyocin domain-containing protein [Pseudomonas chlororaphis subsp. aurantiaca]|uniref:S-type pyocin domain-containing protein n=1 Tax=Pseudomonas chlororaphis TaxID=587753 RepID=UPI0027DE4BEB|nr:S-type pyocin domain-containing protein [Pseudomonas chlororaphis]WMJ01203.1 S-type pyocin domain-containing protein [Pseudomonas chlororaphis subsp. aurantiaca]